MRRLLILAALLVHAAAPLARAESDALERALGAELKRAMAELRQKDYPAPYYVSLTAIDAEALEQKCAMGAASFSSRYRQRVIAPDLRVGGYSLDNRPIASADSMIGREAGMDDDEFALRHALWRMLDDVYKKASADLLFKQAQRVRRGKTEYDTDDLSRETPRVRRDGTPPPAWPEEALRGLCERGSAVFRGSPGLLNAEATIRSQRDRSRLRDSEGTRADFSRSFATLELNAVAVSSDGMNQYANRRFVAAGPASLPSSAEVESAARDMLADLSALKLAQSTSPFSAPALLDPSVAAAIVLATGLRLSGEEQRNPSGAQTFRGKLDKRVMSEDFSLVDDPALAVYGGLALAGRYDLDDQGVPARKAELIARGVLKGFLLSRYPVVGFPKSNGHGRAYPGYAPEGMPGNLVLSARRALPEGELLALLREECRRRGKPYGLWIRKLRNFKQQQGASEEGSIRFLPGLVYLVEAETGRLTLVRDLDVVGTPLGLLGNILRAGDDPRAQNFVSGGVPLSVITPSLLLAEAELQRAETKPERLPILMAPVP